MKKPYNDKLSSLFSPVDRLCFTTETGLWKHKALNGISSQNAYKKEAKRVRAKSVGKRQTGDLSEYETYLLLC